MKLTASDIHVELGGNEILKGIDAAIKEKEFVGIIGPNGSGKSTLLKCIYRVLRRFSYRFRCDHAGWKTAERI